MLNNIYRLVYSLFSPSQPGYLIAFVTSRCNFRCRFCFFHKEIEDQESKKNELTVQEFDEIAKRIGPILQISIGGGEPFIRDDLSDIVSSFVKHTGVNCITIPTNAWYTERIMTFLEKVLPLFPETRFRIVFSIDAIGDKHDELRQMAGAYQHAMKSYEVVAPLREKYSNLILDVNSVYNKETEANIMDTVKYFASGFEFDNISVTYVRGDIKDPELAKASRDQYIAVQDFILKHHRPKSRTFIDPFWRAINDVSRNHLIRTVFSDEFVVPCVAGRKLVVLRENGEVYPCEMLGRCMGNIRDNNYNLGKVLSSEAAKDIQDWVVKSQCKCSFECAQAANVLWNVRAWPRLLRAVLHNLFS
jgi:radical SAM protein with 4Fe4S-binding SPASM domain